MKAEEIRELCRKLKPVLGTRADNLWYFYLAQDERGKRSFEQDIQIIAEKALRKEPLKNSQILLNPPSFEKSVGLFHLGDIYYNNKKLYPLNLNPSDFAKQVGIFSITGEGKTNTAMSLALQLLKYRIPFLVIDWKRSWRDLLSYEGETPGIDIKADKPFTLKDVQVYTIGRDVAPFLWNPFRAPPNTDPFMWVSTIAEVLEKSHVSGAGVASLFNKIYGSIFKKLESHPDFHPNFYDGLQSLDKMKVYAREFMWKQTALRIFSSFTSGNVSKSFNSRTPIKLEEILEKPVILELDMEMPKPLRVFFSEIILRWIHLYRLGQGENDKLRHVFFLEEVHNLFPKTRIERETFSSLENVYRELRAFGQGLVSITQHPSLLPIYLLGNCHTLIFLGLQHEEDIRSAKKSLFLRPDEEEYLAQLEVGEAITRIKNRVEPCLVKVPFVDIRKGLFDDNRIKERAGGYLGFLRAEKGEIPERPVISAADNTGGNKQRRDDLTIRFLNDINDYSLSGLTERYKRLGINPRVGNSIKQAVISGELAGIRKIVTRKGWVALLFLTEKGKGMLRDAGYDTRQENEGIEHKFWKYMVAEYYKVRGYDVEFEKESNGKTDVVVKAGDKKIAIEIETGNSTILDNILRNIEKGYSEVLVVATNEDAEAKVKKILKESELEDAVKVTAALAFDI